MIDIYGTFNEKSGSLINFAVFPETMEIFSLKESLSDE
jgi:hypothetical protein